MRIAVQRLSRNGATFGANIDNKMTTEVQDIATQLGGEKAIGRPIRTERDIDAAIREGFPQKVVTEVMHSADLNPKGTCPKSGLISAQLTTPAPGRKTCEIRVGPNIPACPADCSREAIYRG